MVRNIISIALLFSFLFITNTANAQGTPGKKAIKQTERAERKASFKDFLKEFPESEKLVASNPQPMLKWELYQYLPDTETITKTDQKYRVDFCPVSRKKDGENDLLLVYIKFGLNKKLSYYQIYTFNKKHKCIKIDLVESGATYVAN